MLTCRSIFPFVKYRKKTVTYVNAPFLLRKLLTKIKAKEIRDILVLFDIDYLKT